MGRFKLVYGLYISPIKHHGFNETWFGKTEVHRMTHPREWTSMQEWYRAI